MSGCHLPLEKNENNCICLYCLCERIEKLEEKKETTSPEAKGLFNSLIKESIRSSERVDELFREIQRLEKLINDLASIVNNKKPFLCPSCNGEGVKGWYENHRLVSKKQDCHSCEGKVILWL